MRVIYVVAFVIIYLEMIFKIVVLKSVRIDDIMFTLLFSMQIIMVLNLLCNVFKKKVSKIILIISTIILTLYFSVQAIFYKLFSVPFSFMTLGLAGNALDFTSIIKDAILQNWFTLLLIAIPLILIICLHKKIQFNQFNRKRIGIWLLSIVMYLIILVGVIFIDSKGVYSSYNLLFSINAQEKNIEKFGLINSTTIDLVRTIFGFEEKAVIENDGIDEVKNGKQNEVDGEEANEPEEPTYYVTVSGHAPYNYGSGNSTATMYKAETENLPYSTPVKAYLATQMELDRALETLINKLNEVSRAHNADKNIPPSSGYERFLDNTFNSKYLKNMYNNNWK